MNTEGYNILRLVEQKKEEDNAKTRYQAASRSKLQNAISKRIRTTMIGALATMEEKLGFLFGEDGNRNKEQEHLYNLFKEIRSNILDKGNDQIRQLENDFDAYTIEMKKFYLEFRVQKEGTENDNQKNNQN